jgi:hypothetical protein
VTGEESEECIFKVRCKLYRMRNDEWKERGTGNMKFLRHKESKKIRFVMRQEKTLKPVANFLSNITFSESFQFLLTSFLYSSGESTLRTHTHEEQ